MTPTPTDDMRREFEAWAGKEGLNLIRDPMQFCTYDNACTEFAWRGWQARPVPAGVVAELEGLINNGTPGSLFYSGFDDGVQSCIALVKAHAQPVSLKAISAMLAPIHNRDDAIEAVLKAAGIPYVE